MALFGGKQRPFLGIIFGITEVFGPDGSFAAPARFRIATNGLIWLFKCKRLPTPGLVSRLDRKVSYLQQECELELVELDRFCRS